MASPHFVLFPFMAQGHIIPMIDLAKLLAHRGATVTILTTPVNADRHRSLLSRAVHRGLLIHIALLQFPCYDAGLPHGCENFDLLPLDAPVFSFLTATNLLYHPSETLFRHLRPSPTAIISDLCLPWTLRLSQKHNIPRIVFYSLSFFYLLCSHSITAKDDLIRSLSGFQFVNLIDGFEFRKSQLPMSGDGDLQNFLKELHEVDRLSYGVVVNSFEEMEGKYLAEYKKTRAKPFIWVIRKEIITEELLKWVDQEYEFEEKIKGRGILIRGWAPQVLILSHSAIGCFLMHCGWNSSIEGMSAGVQMITWPLFADQVFNETLMVEILGIGVRVGVEDFLQWGEEEKKRVLVKRENVREAIEMVMDGDER